MIDIEKYKDTIILDYKQIKSLKFLKNKYNYDTRTIKKLLINNNSYIEPYRKTISDSEINDIITKYNNKTPIKEINKIHSIGVKRIYNILKNNNINTNNNIRHKFDRHIFQNIDSEKKAYWLGFLYADGNIYKTKDNISHHITIKLSIKDIDHLYKFKRDFSLPHSIRTRKSITFGKIFESATLRICSKHMTNDLIKNGCVQNKSFILEYPYIDEKLHNHFIRGYFDGDGSISITEKQHQMYFAGNYNFLRKIREILTFYCGLKKNKIHKKGNIYTLPYYGDDKIIKIRNFLYNDFTTCLERKREKFYSI